MKTKPIIIIAGEPYSVFLEIFLKSFKKGLLKNLKLGDYSKPINVSNGVMLLLVKDKRKISKIISIEEEFKKLIIKEKNNQLNQFSNIHYKKLELNTEINEN